MSGTLREPVISPTEGIAKISREAWNGLLREDDSPFLDWDWINALESSGCAARETGWAPYHLVVRTRPEQKIVAACPLYLKTHSMGEFVFDHGWADAAERAGLNYFPKLLVGVPFTPHTGRRFLTAPDVNRAQMVELLSRALAAICTDNKLSSTHINFCEADEAQQLVKLGFLERLGYQYHWRNDGFTDFDGYLGQLKSKRRYAVRHERAALTEQNVKIRVLTGDEISASLSREMFPLYRSTIDKLYWGRQYLTHRFFETIAKDFKRHLCLVLAFQGERLIAGTINVQKAGVLYGRYWGAFKELRYLHFNVCYYAAIEHCIREKIERFEPGAGGEYKWLRGFNPALTRSAHFLADGGLRKAVAGFLNRERREVEAWIIAGHANSQLKAPPPSNTEPSD